MLNREMLKQQSVPVGDVDTIANAIDRQKVKNESAKLFGHKSIKGILERLMNEKGIKSYDIG
jgi:hypothetical protein